MTTNQEQPLVIERLRREVVERYGAAPDRVRVVRSPYRVCPLGAHIDHQLGPVTAMAIDHAVLLAYAPAADREVQLSSLDFPGDVRFSIDHVPPRQADCWGNFPRGAARALRERHGLKRGIVGVTSGKLHGGGVSSSAAVGIAFLLAFEDANDIEICAEENIELDRSIENDYLGLRNGILDQAAILLSRRGHLTQIDCRTSQHALIPAAPGMPPFKILLAFSGLRQSLVGTEYNRRVEECSQAARTLLSALGRNGHNGHSPVLGDISAEEYATHRSLLQGACARRAAHFFSEIDRVHRGVAAWRRGDLAGLGTLMTASGESSIRNYECGSTPLIDLFQTLITTEGVHGARFSGAGFRGYCAALVEPAALETAARRVSALYAKRHPDLAAHASIVLCETGDGAGILDGRTTVPRSEPERSLPS